MAMETNGRALMTDRFQPMVGRSKVCLYTAKTHQKRYKKKHKRALRGFGGIKVRICYFFMSLVFTGLRGKVWLWYKERFFKRLFSFREWRNCFII